MCVGGGYSGPTHTYLLSEYPLEVYVKIPCFPCVLTKKIQISCVFPDRELFGPFSLFSLCRGYPVLFFPKMPLQTDGRYEMHGFFSLEIPRLEITFRKSSDLGSTHR